MQGPGPRPVTGARGSLRTDVKDPQAGPRACGVRTHANGASSRKERRPRGLLRGSGKAQRLGGRCPARTNLPRAHAKAPLGAFPLPGPFGAGRSPGRGRAVRGLHGQRPLPSVSPPPTAPTVVSERPGLCKRCGAQPLSGRGLLSHFSPLPADFMGRESSLCPGLAHGALPGRCFARSGPHPKRQHDGLQTGGARSLRLPRPEEGARVGELPGSLAAGWVAGAPASNFRP